MSTIDFYKVYPDEIGFMLKFKSIREIRREFCVKKGMVFCIIGRRTGGNMNVKTANIE